MPLLKLTWTRWEDRYLSMLGRHPIAFIADQSWVQARTALSSGICPPLSAVRACDFTTATRPCSSIRSGKWPLSDAVGVGQYEDAPTPMACADLSRCEQPRLCSIAQSRKASGDIGKSQRDMSFDVLKEDRARRDLCDDAFDFGP